jgi:hypothetical protein
MTDSLISMCVVSIRREPKGQATRIYGKLDSPQERMKEGTLSEQPQEKITTAAKRHRASLGNDVARKQDQQTKDQPGRINPEPTAAESKQKTQSRAN